jgi:hypothetical protein
MKNTPAIEPGQGEGITENSLPDTALDPNRQRIDPRLAFLACAAARFDLVEACAMTLDEVMERSTPSKRAPQHTHAVVGQLAAKPPVAPTAPAGHQVPPSHSCAPTEGAS